VEVARAGVMHKISSSVEVKILVINISINDLASQRNINVLSAVNIKAFMEYLTVIQ